MGRVVIAFLYLTALGSMTFGIYKLFCLMCLGCG